MAKSSILTHAVAPAIWAGFTVFGLASCIQFAKPATSFRTNSLCVFAIWAGFTVFGLFSTYLIIGGWGARPKADPPMMTRHMGGLYFF